MASRKIRNGNFRSDYLPFSTVYGAKGYDALIVFLIGTEHISTGRATFYVGATKAKLLLYITGVEREKCLLPELQRVFTLLTKQQYEFTSEVLHLFQVENVVAA